MKLEMFDTTLRDGAQTEGISFSVSDKLAVVNALGVFYPELAGVHLIDYKVRVLETGHATGSRN